MAPVGCPGGGGSDTPIAATESAMSATGAPATGAPRRNASCSFRFAGGGAIRRGTAGRQLTRPSISPTMSVIPVWPGGRWPTVIAGQAISRGGSGMMRCEKALGRSPARDPRCALRRPHSGNGFETNERSPKWCVKIRYLSRRSLRWVPEEFYDTFSPSRCERCGHRQR